MGTKHILDSLEEYYYSPESAYLDNGIKVSISLSPCLCSVELSKEIDIAANPSQLLKQLNCGQKLARYDLCDGRLFLKTTMWVDAKPTRTGLSEVINIFTAQFNSAFSLLTGVINGQ